MRLCRGEGVIGTVRCNYVRQPIRPEGGSGLFETMRLAYRFLSVRESFV